MCSYAHNGMNDEEVTQISLLKLLWSLYWEEKRRIVATLCLCCPHSMPSLPTSLTFAPSGRRSWK